MEMALDIELALRGAAEAAGHDCRILPRASRRRKRATRKALGSSNGASRSTGVVESSHHLLTDESTSAGRLRPGEKRFTPPGARQIGHKPPLRADVPSGPGALNAGAMNAVASRSALDETAFGWLATPPGGDVGHLQLFAEATGAAEFRQEPSKALDSRDPGASAC